MDVYYLRLGGDGLVQVPGWWFDVLLGWFALMGVCVWLFGRGMARATFTVWGLSIGALASWLMVRLLSSDGLAIPWVVLGSLCGGIGGFLAYRLIVAASCGLIVAVLGCSIAGWAMDPQDPVVWPAVQKASGDTQHAVLETTRRVEAAKADGRPVIAKDHDDFRLGAVFLNGLRDVVKAQGVWFGGLTIGARGLMVVLFLGGMLGGAVFGLVAPGASIMLATSMGGVVMFLGGVCRLLAAVFGTSGFMPITYQGWTIVLLVLGGVGYGVQWAIFKESPA